MKTFEIVIALFLLNNKDRKTHFFKKTFLLPDININIAFGMVFFILSNIQINLNNQGLKLRSYTTKNVLPTTKQIKLVGNKKFAVVVLDLEDETFIV